MNATDLSDAKYAAREGRAFMIMAEFHGANWNNQSGRSDKFWLIERVKDHGPIQIRYGKTGSIGATANEGIDLYDALGKLYGKESKGYRVTYCKSAPAKPSITTAPAPFNAVRVFRTQNANMHLCDALDARGVLVATVPARVAHEITAKYDLAA